MNLIRVLVIFGLILLSSTLANPGDDPNNYAGDENADEFEDYISSDARKIGKKAYFECLSCLKNDVKNTAHAVKTKMVKHAMNWFIGLLIMIVLQVPLVI